MLRVEADDLRIVDSVSSGDVAVAVGLPHAATGDTLVEAASSRRGLRLDGVTVPPPVFSLAVEAESSSQQVRFINDQGFDSMTIECLCVLGFIFYRTCYRTCYRTLCCGEGKRKGICRVGRQ